VNPSQIRFGTDGWRGLIAEDFTFDNVRACAQGVAAYHKAQSRGATPLVVGFDTRFASEDFAAAAAEVLAGNGVPVLLCSRAAPTPVVSYTIVARRAAGGVIITASHNPAAWNGFKYRMHYGGSPPPPVLSAIEGHIGQLQKAEPVRRLPLAEGRARGSIRDVEPQEPYLEHLARVLDPSPLRRAGLRVAVDAMHGAGAGYMGRLLEGGATQVLELRGERNPAFPAMHNPEPVERNLLPLSQAMMTEGADVGLALDGDADRLGVVDEAGKFVTPLQVFGLLLYYFLEVRGLRGPVIKSLTTTSMAWRLGERYGVPVQETGVGFKYIAPLMTEGEALIGGEESGGYAFRGHIPERDGILSGLFMLDLMARTGKRVSQLLEELYRLVGPHHYSRQDVPLGPQEQEGARVRLARAHPKELCGIPVVEEDTLDGFRFILKGGAWVIIRPSGTEPLLRLYAEAESPQRVQELLAAARSLAAV
jgi:phosphomannomutase